jgi:hypothetical protein
VVAVTAGRKRLAQVMPTIPLAGPTPEAWYEPAQVTAVAAGEASDGAALVTVSWRNGSYEVPYLDSYSPVVGNTVLLIFQHPQVVIVGRVIGTP